MKVLICSNYDTYNTFVVVKKIWYGGKFTGPWFDLQQPWKMIIIDSDCFCSSEEWERTLSSLSDETLKDQNPMPP